MANVTRRGIAGGALAVLFSGAGASGSAKPVLVSDDSELFRIASQCLDVGRQFRRVEQQQTAVPRPMAAADEVEWNCLDDVACGLSARVAVLEEQLRSLSPRTALGGLVARQALALSEPPSRRPAGLEKALELSLAKAERL